MYKQVLAILKEQITSGKLQEGDRLPSELTLMHEFGVSRITIRTAIAEMVDDGLLVRSQGKGTFVAQPSISQPANDAIGFNRSCILAGKTPFTQLLSIEWVFPTDKQVTAGKEPAKWSCPCKSSSAVSQPIWRSC